MNVNLLIAWDWPYDEPFMRLLTEAFQARDLTLLQATPRNLVRILDGLSVGRYSARAFLDRAADTSPQFEPLVDWARKNVPVRINPYERRSRAWIKTNLHWEFINAGIHTPYTIPIPSFNRQPALDPTPDLSPLGAPFSIKPDWGGGSWGVVTDANDWQDVQAAREALPSEALILQEFVEPETLRQPGWASPRRAWFRTLYACGRVLPCWWDDQTRLYLAPVTEEERAALGLDPLWEIAAAAARIAGLGLFSTEVARVPDGRYIVVDYVNDPVDLRFRPHAREGMPPEVARSVAEALAGFVEEIR